MNLIEKKKLKARAHPLNPVVMIGQSGLTQAVLKEINLALDTHELIKIKIRAEREQRKELTEQIGTEVQAELIQSIGQVAVFFRKNPKK